MPAVAVDGVNVLAVRHAVADAVDRARAGGGPTFIEVPVYRFRAHGGAGDDSRSGYRDEAERALWETVDPLHLFAAFLTRASILTPEATARMEQDIADEIADAFEFALASANPIEGDLYRHVYAN